MKQPARKSKFPYCRNIHQENEIIHSTNNAIKECVIYNQNNIESIFSNCQHTCCPNCIQNIKKTSIPKIIDHSKEIKDNSYHHYLYRDH